ncbi:hypothetical protein QFC22_003042 [Naganishia vaughanmartiniae]|uniref:Uncharacterized protein n=1 Tax=Naganishia vaughanmartiniae TaxID=1424756 RepID=A0ACC2X7Z6_9TREE|nr:hypothetical protein QFC22_003042 [Naganishia vaughanmartiniae]
MAVSSISEAGRFGKSKAEVHRNKQAYTHTFTSVMDYPKKAPELVPPASDSTATKAALSNPPQRSQRKAKFNAINKMDITREREATVPPSTASASSSTISKDATPKVTLLPSVSSGLTSATSSTTSQPTGPKPSNNPIVKKSQIPKAPALNRKSVKWSGPREPKPRDRPRLFGLKDCPVFYPTPEEFQDPMQYLKMIGDEGRGKEYGMCKIVPPEGWQMPFVLDTEIFRFQTRLQRLNSLEASSRAKLNFLDQLYMFHKQQGSPNVTIPTLDHRPVDIWALRKAVNKAGGLVAVNNKKGWGEITKSLGYTYAQTPHVKSAYLKIVQPFDDFYTHVKTSPMSQVKNASLNIGSPLTPLPGDLQPPPSTTNKSLSGTQDFSATPSRIVGNVERLGSPVRSSNTEAKDVLHRLSDSKEQFRRRNGYGKGKTSSSPEEDQVYTKDLDEVENAIKVPSTEPSDSQGEEAHITGQKRKRRTDGSAIPATPPAKRAGIRQGRMGFVGGGGAGPNESFVEGDACEVCRSGRDGTKMLLCDECDKGFHIYCLDPPLSKVPVNEEWYCSSCLLGTGNDYGFDVGQEHSIHTFQERARAFKHEYFKSHRPKIVRPPNLETCEDFGDIKIDEAEVETEFWRLVENEYETVEVEYGADVHSITHGRSDISGMTVPWAYIGMLFSAFCWHNEDHHTYSVNYMYWGSTKTWYGIPGAHAEKFEETIMKEAPELFEQQPGLLYQLVTMMNPGRLQTMGVDVFAVDQRPNEFVITFPKAYHCGFNHGLNFNEAVNFALPDWLPFGKECVARYQLHCKPPVFSHEELLMTISQFSKTIETAIWLDQALKKTIDTEITKRDALRKNALHLGEIIDSADKLEEQYTCCVCKAFCYLSQVTCSCTSNVTCLDHAASVCKCPMSTRILRKRASEEYLHQLQATIHERAMIPSDWRKRFQAMMAETPRPPVKSLRSAIMEAERIIYPIPELDTLRPLMAEVNAWMAGANKLLNRKKSIKKRGRPRNDEADDVDEDESEKASAEVVQKYIKASEDIGFEAPETQQLRQLASSINEFENRAKVTLNTTESDLSLQDVEGILLLGESLPVEVPELGQLRMLANRLKWFAEMEDLDEAFLELKDVIDYVQRAHMYAIPTDHEFVRNLSMKLDNGREWLSTAEGILNQHEAWQVEGPDEAPLILIEEIDELLRQDIDRPVVGEVMGKLGQFKVKIQSAQATLRSITSLAGHRKRGTIQQVQKAFLSAQAKACAVDLRDMPEWKECVNALEGYQKWLDALKAALGMPTASINTEIQDALYRDFEAILSVLDPDDDNYTKPEVEISPSGKTVYHAEATCICRRKAGPKMIQCRHCSELYHPRCLSLDPVETSTDKKIKCTFCKSRDIHNLRDSRTRPSILRLVPLIDEEQWNFRFPVDEQDTVRSIVETAVRVAKIMLPLALSATNQDVKPAEEELVVQFWLKKLQHVPFEIEVERKDEERIQVYPALINKLKSLRKKKKPIPVAAQSMESLVNTRFRNGWPTLIFRRWMPGDRTVRCLCRRKPADSFLRVTCGRCDQRFHASCVAAPAEALGCDGESWTCPFCAINDGMEYQYAEVRSQLPGQSFLPLDLSAYAYSCRTIVDHFGTQIFIDGPETIQRGLQYVTRLQSNRRGDADRQLIHLEVLTFYADEPVVPGSIARATQPAQRLDNPLVQAPSARAFALSTSQKPSTFSARCGAVFPQQRPLSGTPDSSSTWRESPARFGVADSDRTSSHQASGRIPLSPQSERIYPPSAAGNTASLREDMDLRPTSSSQRPSNSRVMQPLEPIPYHRPVTWGDASHVPPRMTGDRYSGRRDLPGSSTSGRWEAEYGYGDEQDRHHAGSLRIDQPKPLGGPRGGNHAYPPQPPHQRYDPRSGIAVAPLQRYTPTTTVQQQQPTAASSGIGWIPQQIPLPSSRFTSHMYIPPFQSSTSEVGAGARSADGTEV